MNIAGKKRAGQVPAVNKVAEPKATYPTPLSINPAEAREAVAAETTDPVQVADAAPAAPIRLLSKKRSARHRQRVLSDDLVADAARRVSARPRCWWQEFLAI
jgi:hypothetical protein